MANDVYVLQIAGFVSGQYVENVLAYQNQGAGTGNPESDANDLVNAWQSNVQADWLSAVSDDYILTGLSARRVNNTGGNSAVLTGIGQAGTIGSNSVMSGAGVLIDSSYRNSGGAPARWRVGRLFLPACPATEIIGNVIQPTLAGAVNALIVKLNSGITSGANTFLYGIWSRKQKAFYSPTLIYTSNLIGTQRRRFRPAL